MQPYLILFFLNFLEGSVITLGAGLSAQATHLDYCLALLTLITADIVSDLFYYGLGRFGGGILHTKYARIIGVTEHHLDLVESYYSKHGKITLFFAKMSDLLAMPAVIIAGAIKMKLRDYIAVSVVTSILKAVLLFSAGYLLGNSLGRNGLVLIQNMLSGLFILILTIFIFRYFYVKIRQDKALKRKLRQ